MTRFKNEQFFELVFQDILTLRSSFRQTQKTYLSLKMGSLISSFLHPYNFFIEVEKSSHDLLSFGEILIDVNPYNTHCGGVVSTSSTEDVS